MDEKRDKFIYSWDGHLCLLLDIGDYIYAKIFLDVFLIYFMFKERKFSFLNLFRSRMPEYDNYLIPIFDSVIKVMKNDPIIQKNLKQFVKYLEKKYFKENRRCFCRNDKPF